MARDATKLGKQLYVVFTDPVPNGGDRSAAREQHLAYQYELERRGIMFAAGPFLDEQGNSTGSGMIIYRADSLEHATEIASNDPFHKLGFRKFRIAKWRISEGMFTLRVDFSTGAYKLD
jgi:uncharacterized protein YciI